MPPRTSLLTFISKMNKEKEIFNYLNKIGCCKHCCLRYICVRNPEHFSKSDSYIKQVFKKPHTFKVMLFTYIYRKTSSKASNRTRGLWKNWNWTPASSVWGCWRTYSSMGLSKRLRKTSRLGRTIPVCSRARLASRLAFTYENMAWGSIWRGSIQNFSPKVRSTTRDVNVTLFFCSDVLETQLNKAWKWVIRDRLESRIGKTFEQSDTCDFSINIILGYDSDSDELAVLPKMQPILFTTRQTQRRKYPEGIYSRKSVLEALSKTDTKIFKEYATVPPDVSDQSLRLKEITCFHSSIFLAGRYGSDAMLITFVLIFFLRTDIASILGNWARLRGSSMASKLWRRRCRKFFSNRYRNC